MQLKTHSEGLRGRLKVASDKSMSHRALMLGAISQGKTIVHDLLCSEDVLSTLQAFRQLGVDIQDDGELVTIEGKGFEGLQAPEQVLAMGNSGTSMRLMAGILAGLPFKTVMSGDDSLSRRPMDRIAVPLRLMGADISGRTDSCLAPLRIGSVKGLRAIDYEIPVASAQVKSALIFAALQADGLTRLLEKEKTRNHTEEMLLQFGGEIRASDRELVIPGQQRLQGCQVKIAGDISSAAFWLVAGLIVPNSEIILENAGVNETRTGILDVIVAMGGNLEFLERDDALQTATLRVKTSELHGTEIAGDLIPRLIDELPVIALLATQAEGTTIIRDAAELRLKETDRIASVSEALQAFGAEIQPRDDGMIIEGPSALRAPLTAIDSHGDHRLGMMTAIAALLVKKGEVVLKGAETIRTSYPQFFEDLSQLTEG